MATTITGSSNISVLDSNILADTCAGNFYIDISPSVFIGSGQFNILGANVRVTNPLGVIIKDFITSGYDIDSAGSPPLEDVVEVGIPTEAGNYQYGAYTVLVTLYDAGGSQYSITKTITLSVPNPLNKTKKFGVATATIKGLCKDGKAVIQVATPQNYRGQIVESVDQEFTLTYPGGSDRADFVTGLSAFSVYLYEGEYKIVGEICATYNLGDNVYVSILYKLNFKQNVACIVNLHCVLTYLASELKNIDSDCTDEEKNDTITKVGKALGYLKAAELAAEYNEDASVHINSLEALLGCKCTCDSNDGVPIINNAPAKDFLIEGCNVTKSTVGLTDHYLIENYGYKVEVQPNGNALYVSSTTLANCTKTINLVFDISVVYTQIKNLANASDQANFWASVVNKAITTADPDNLGLTQEQWNALTLKERIQAIIDVIDVSDAPQYANGVELFSLSGDYVGLGGDLVRDTTLGGNFVFRLSEGKWQVDSITGLGGAAESGFSLKVTGNTKSTGQSVYPQQTLTYGATTTWNMNNGEEAKLTLTGNTILAIINALAVSYGSIDIVQDGTGSRTITLPTGSIVENGGGGAITLTPTPNAIDTLVFKYDGTNYRWVKKLNFT